MKIPKIVHTFGQIDDDLVAAAAAPVRKSQRRWVKWTVLAASLGLVILAGAIALPMLLGGDDVLPGIEQTDTEQNVIEQTEKPQSQTAQPQVTPPEMLKGTVAFSDLNRNYKKQDAVGQELAIEWADEYLTPHERHWSIIWDLRNYVSGGVMVQPEHLGEKLGDYLDFEIRSLRGMPEEYAIAVGYQGTYYTYRYRDDLDQMPGTLGELFDKYNLAMALELNRFSTVINKYETTGYYGLTDDAYIIETLASCRDAALYVSEDGKEWEQSDEYLSFTVTSDALGVYKRVFQITKDGYLRTNVFEYAYIYEIGTEVAGKIIDYAMANAAERAMEPYENRLAGTLIEIKDGYAYIDDSIMCENESEGMIFRVSTEDIRIARWLNSFVEVGDFVVVEFRGKIDLDNGNLVLDARSIQTASLVHGDAIVPE